LSARPKDTPGHIQYLEMLERELSIPELTDSDPLALDLFAGCGGLALGFEAAGFRTIGYEMLQDASETYRTNLHGHCHCQVLEIGQDLCDAPDIIIGGPPCQPFSVGGLQAGPRDARDGFPVFLDAVERYKPKVAVFENVRGMLYRNRGYLDLIIDELERMSYCVDCEILKALDFGVPQRRERVFVVAYNGPWKRPAPTWTGAPITAGQALGDMAYSIPAGSRFLTESMDTYVAKYEAASKCITPRDLHLDAPSRTVTCRNLNGATGDMLRVKLPDGRRRRLVAREGARLQSFPDSFTFCGNEGNQFNQVGNAVPPLLAKGVAMSIRACLKGDHGRSRRRHSSQFARQIDLFGGRA